MKETRAYRSTLRQDFMEQTRQKIVDACVDLLADPSRRELAIPDVAKAAGVAERTVFRHFATRDDLLAAAWRVVMQRTRLADYPQTEEELLARITPTFKGLDENAELVRSMVLSPVGWEVRVKGDAGRHAGVEKALADTLAQLPAARRKQLVGLVLALFSASTWQLLRDREGMHGKAAGDAVTWAVKALIDSARRAPAEVGKTTRPKGKG